MLVRDVHTKKRRRERVRERDTQSERQRSLRVVVMAIPRRVEENDENSLPEGGLLTRDEIPILRASEKGEDDEEDEEEEGTEETLESSPTTTRRRRSTIVPPSPMTKPNLLASPPNFGMVLGSIYRSSFPRPENFAFLEQLHLKSVLVLIPEPYPEENIKFLDKNQIQFFQVGMSGNKEPFVHVSHATITSALEIALNPNNHPLLIHCNRGKHRTGCLVGCIRRLQDWSLTMIFDEYRRFAFPKTRPLDQQLIELYDDSEIYDTASRNEWLTFRY